MFLKTRTPGKNPPIVRTVQRVSFRKLGIQLIADDQQCVGRAVHCGKKSLRNSKLDRSVFEFKTESFNQNVRLKIKFKFSQIVSVENNKK